MKNVNSILRKVILKMHCRYGRRVKCGAKSIINLNSSFEKNNIVGNSCLLNDVHLGIGTYMGNNCSFTGTQLGKYTCVANNVKNIVGNHPINEMASIHPAFYSTERQAGFTYTKEQKYEEYKYINYEKKLFNLIGNDVWIGEDVLILSNLVIGDGAIIGAGSVVTKDCEPYGIYVGNPAKLIRRRYSEDIIDQLLHYKWWDKNEKWIMNNICYFEDVNLLLEKLKSEK